MVVNVDLMSQQKVRGPLTPRPEIAAVRLSGNEMRRHEQIMEYRAKVNTLDANLKSALNALASANADIARLNAELDGLRAQNAQLKKDLDLALEKARNTAQKGMPKKNRDGRGGRPESPDSGSSH